ncbi:hypothetical protein GGX14DRAFT_568555 [Mycena pura]|uniref:Uncharacterized protein n=1 Tax=Mycena pura TaxID=153505 RepID=A0AAD6Y8Y1_9AGAR|nr:hypothetical protein GGX14DRAFT_568555 [Mycena pura]
MAKNKRVDKKRDEDSDANSDDDTPQKKRGQPSDFAGQRLAFLTSKIAEYVVASKKKGTKLAKTEGLRAFWPKLFDEYWARFPWDLPLTVEPDGATLDANAAPPETTADDALHEDTPESDPKSKVMKDTKAKIKRWFWRQRAGTMGIHGNPYFAQLARLRRDESTTGPPKRPANFQWYMRHADYKEGVNKRFLGEHGDAPKERHIVLRCEVAREMLKEEPEEVQAKIKAGCDAAHAEELEAMPDCPTPIQRSNASECRENFLGIVQPRLAGLHQYTGLILNIIGARINEDTQEFETMSANAGVVGGKDWARWDPEGYSSMLKNYLKFVHAQHLESQNLMDAGPSTVPPNPSGKPSTATPAPVAAPPNAAATQPSDLLESNGLLRFHPDGDVNMDGDDEVPVITPAPSAPVVTPAPSTPVVTPAPVVAAAPSAPVVTAAPSAPVGPAPTWGLKILRDDLRAEILAKSGDERDHLVWRLGRMNDYMLECENNLARNRRLLRELDLDRVTDLLGMKRPKEGGKKAKSRKKAKKGEEDEWSSDADSDADNDNDNGDEEGEEEDGPARVRTPPMTRGAAARGGRTAKGGAKWAETARSMLLEVEMGDDWKEVVSLWWTLEERWKFASSTKSHATTHRPKAVGVWVKNARKGNPDIGSASGMEREWWAWWKGINPGWRMRDGELL